MKKTISVIGSASASEELLKIAYAVGKEIAQREGVLICGGLGGIMEAASRGAKESGGLVVGILPGAESVAANRYIDIPIRTGLDEARNLVVAVSADAVIAVGGELGTLSELAFAMKSKRPVFGIQTWKLDESYCGKVNLVHVDDPREAVEKAFSCI